MLVTKKRPGKAATWDLTVRSALVTLSNLSNVQTRTGDYLAFLLNPAPLSLRLLLVWWVSDDDGDRFVAFDPICVFAGLRNWSKDSRYPLLVVVRVT
jgi:hypothetical protein